MKRTAIIAALATLLAVPALAADEGNANAEGQTQPTPNRGGTAGGPAHGPSRPPSATDARPSGPAHDSSPSHDANKHAR